MSVVFGGGPLASRRTRASIAKASITKLTYRCQPCHERLSLWASPSSVLAVSNASSMAQRRPSTVTSFSTGVPAGHHVVEYVSAPSDRLRRTSRPRVHRL